MAKKDDRDQLPFERETEPPTNPPSGETARTDNPPAVGGGAITRTEEKKPPAPPPATELLATLSKDQVQAGFRNMLKDRAPSFLASLVNTVNSSADLKAISLTKKGAAELVACATMAACLNLVIDKNLGFAWVVAYRDKEGVQHPQFQIGYKGFIQLAQRTGQYERINCVPVYKNQFISYNYLTEDLDADFNKAPEGPEVGYAMYFRLLNGFEKTVYKTVEELDSHGRKYSKSFNNTFGLWKTNPPAMRFKTLVKMVLSKWGILSTEMQRAIMADQAIVPDGDMDNREMYVYPDNEPGALTGEQPPEMGEGKAGEEK